MNVIEKLKQNITTLDFYADLTHKPIIFQQEADEILLDNILKEEFPH